MVSMQQAEALVGSRFYFEADGLTEKLILEVSGVSNEAPSAGAEAALGSTKGAKITRQPTPTIMNLAEITVKLILTNNKDFYQWFADNNPRLGGKSNWEKEGKSASLVRYGQDGNEQIRWNIKSCFPNQYEGPSLDANSTDFVNETFTIIHGGLQRVL